MSLISDKDKDMLKELFESRLKNNVELKFFYSEKENCKYCKETGDILDELAAINELITVKKYSIEDNKDLSQGLGIEMAPAIVTGPENNVRFFGIPAGHEFTTLVEDILDISSVQDKNTSETFSKWPQSIIDSVNQIKNPVHIQVFVTIGCPYCPKAVRFAHKLALLNKNITADMVESAEFQEMAKEFNVSGVPKTVINHGAAEFTGLHPDEKAIEEVLKASVNIE